MQQKESQKELWKIFFIEGSIYLLTSLLALAGAFQLKRLEDAHQIYLPQTTLQDFLFSFFVGTVLVLALIALKHKKTQKWKPIIYKGFFLVTCFWGGMALLQAYLPVLFAVGIMGLLIFLWMHFQSVWAHNTLVIVALAGTAGFLGLQLSVSGVLLLLLILSLYDFIAVYKTKHMVQMAKEMIEKRVIIGFIIPRDLSGFKEPLSKVKPGGNFMILGGGDVVFPNILVAALVREGIGKSLIVLVFALIGTFLSYYMFASQKPARPGGEKEPVPALPPIALSCVVGYIITLLI